MKPGLLGVIAAVTLTLTGCAEQGWMGLGQSAAGYPSYGVPGYDYTYPAYPPAGGIIVGGFGPNQGDWDRDGRWRSAGQRDWTAAERQRYWQFQQQKAQNEGAYRARALQWEQQTRENEALYRQRALQWQQQQTVQQAQNEAVYRQRALQWEQQQRQQQGQRQWDLMVQEWKRQHPGQ